MKNAQRSKGIWQSALAILLTVSMMCAASVMCFAETAEETAIAPTEISNMSISLGEDIIVKIHTDATTGDGSKLVIGFDGNTYEITENVDGVFEFVGVTPQKLGKTVTAELHYNGAQVGETKNVSVKSYLEGLLAFSYEESGCESTLQYEAMRELCVNMLNYGAAAQSYVEYDVENLANAGLTEEQKALATETITVADSDKAVNGAAWVGAGVRFDYKLGLYFVFEADSADEYKAYINDTEVTPEAYAAMGEGKYVIRYSGFNATNMNSVVTAKLTKSGEADQTFAYSVKSYVAAKGGDGSAIAKLVNATYVYGFAAVAYSAEYVTVDPTFEQTGSISMDGKGYDFTETKYGTVMLPKLNFTDYTVEVDFANAEAVQMANNIVAPEVYTVFTHDTVEYSKSLETDNCIELEGKYYTEYNIEQFKDETVAVTYDETNGYTYDVADGKTAYPTDIFMAYGADFTVTGKIVMESMTNVWGFWNIDATLGTEDKAANITLTSSAEPAVRLNNDADVTVSSGSTVEITSSTTYSIYIGAGEHVDGSSLIVDGTVTVNSGTMRASHAVKVNESYEYGFEPSIYVRSGKLTVPGIYTWSLQVGSEEEDLSGTLNITGAAKNAGIEPQQAGKYTNKWVFAKGTVESSVPMMYCKDENGTDTIAYVDIRKGMTIKNTSGNYTLAVAQHSSDITNVYLQQGITVDATDTSTFLYVNKTDSTGNVYIWDEFTAKVDGVEKTVRVVVNKTYNKNTNMSVAAFKTDVNGITLIPENVDITSSTTTLDAGALGTFYQGTYTDASGATQTVWYQIVD